MRFFRSANLKFAALLVAVLAGLLTIGHIYGAPVAIAAFLAVNGLAQTRLLSHVLGAMPTLLDMAKLTGNDAAVGLIEENQSKAPEMAIFPMRSPIRGTSYKTGIRTGLPTVGFRSANAGVTPSKSTFKQAIVECFIIDAQIIADKAVADANEGGAAEYQAIEASGVAEAALRTIGRQIFYGVANDALGFPGLKAFLPFGDSSSYGDALTVNAAGTTADTASSVYAVKFGLRDAILVPGNGTVMELGEWRIQTIADPNDSTKMLTAYVNGLGSWIGLQLGNENCARRIANLTADNGKGLTDSLLADLLSTFPTGSRPDAIFASRRSVTQLQKSRTVTLQGQGRNRPDQEVVAPRPTSYEGIPIVETDSILNTDAIES